jgi:DNA mismatch repair protein MutS2
MRLEEYWGIGPKTRARLEAELGTERAVAAIESGNTRALVEAGVPRGRATTILRRAQGGDTMDLLATRDTRDVYKALLDLAGEHALTEDAASSIRILTPLATRERMRDRLDRIEGAREAWTDLDVATREAVEDIFSEHDSAGGELASVRTALGLSRTGVSTAVFEPVATLDEETLEDAASALAGLHRGGDGVGDGADDRLDELREGLAAVEDMAATPASVVETIQSQARNAGAFRETLVDHVTSETQVDVGRVREAAAVEAADASDFVTSTLRALTEDLRAAVDEREREVADRLEAAIDDARPTVDAAVEAVDDVALYLSLARFATEFDLTRPGFADRETVAVANARNLSLVAVGTDVQPVTYALGDHDLDLDSPDGAVPPAGHRVSVVTGANSGGKTTLLETLCQVQLLAQMGLPVPAESATVGVVDTVVFHRRHASFNAGVLESTLRSVVPPLTDEGHALMLVDEFEAITEPGSAADLLHGLVRLTVERGALGAFVTHLADDLEPLPPEARTDGIFAEGLSRDLELEVDYQPRFETVGRSTPEFIVSRLVANAGDRDERSGFETLAEAVGEEAVQRTLSDARWSA